MNMTAVTRIDLTPHSASPYRRSHRDDAGKVEWRPRDLSGCTQESVCCALKLTEVDDDSISITTISAQTAFENAGR